MSLTFAYNVRHLLNRKVSTILTLLGISMVVFVFVSTLMLAQGLRDTLAATGEEENAIVIRQGALNEIQSGISREHAAHILTDPGIERLPSGEALATNDLLVLLNMKRRNGGQPSNVNVRGVSAHALEVRPSVKLVEGRVPARGTQEVMVGDGIRRKFSGTEIGETLRMGGTDWTIVGRFDAGNSGFSSEIWGDADIMMPAFKRERFSSVTARLRSGESFDEMRNRLEEDRQLSVDVRRERSFYEDQSYALATFIRYLGTFVTIIFSLAAIVGCTITMFSAVAYRTREIGVLRALGFGRFAVLDAFLREAAILSAAGGIVGILAASAMSFVTVSTTNFQTFSEINFGFSLTWAIAVDGLCFAMIMGIVGALIPAVRAARVRPVEALRR